MNRKEMIKILQAIKERRLSVESLQPPKMYIFRQRSNNPGIYEMNGQEYTETERQDFCKKIYSKNNNSIIWNEGKTYPIEDTIITMKYMRNP